MQTLLLIGGFVVLWVLAGVLIRFLSDGIRNLWFYHKVIKPVIKEEEERKARDKHSSESAH